MGKPLGARFKTSRYWRARFGSMGSSTATCGSSGELCLLASREVVASITWLVAPGLGMIAVTYGLARFAYGLFLPEMRETLGLSETTLGLIGAGSYVGYCFAIVIALVFTSRTGPRFIAVAAGVVAVVGMAAVAGAPGPGS
jgi:Uncharacterised MFS-type transporter YbfB